MRRRHGRLCYHLKYIGTPNTLNYWAHCNNHCTSNLYNNSRKKVSVIVVSLQRNKIYDIIRVHQVKLKVEETKVSNKTTCQLQLKIMKNYVLRALA